MKYQARHLIFALVSLALLTVAAFAQSERDRGIELYRQNEFQKAADVLQAVVAADKNNRLAWVYLGMSHARLGDMGKAVKYLRKAEGISVKDSVSEKRYDQQVKIISKPRPRYTDAARKNQTVGRVKLMIEFGANGKDIFVIPLDTLPDRLTEECVYAAENIKFQPAMKRRQSNFKY